jgi:hypothetical protein
MQRNVECEAGLLPSEEPWRQPQVRGAADGQEFCESLDEAKDDGLEDGQRVVS